MDFEQLKAIPTYTLMRLAVLFVREDHPWYNKCMSLSDWTENQTPLNKQLNIVLWLNIALTVFLVITFIVRY